MHRTGTLCMTLLAAAAPPARGQDGMVYHDNVMIVLDASGSMRDAMRGSRVIKMQAAQHALKEVLAKVPPSTHIGLLVFGGSHMPTDLAYPLGPRDDEALRAAIDRPQPEGGTPLGQYIKKGADLLLAERTRQMGYGTYRLLIVTDGEAQDQLLVNAYTPEVLARGIAVDVIGVDMTQTHTLAHVSTSYRRADDPAALSRAIAEVFAEVGGAADSGVAGEDAFAVLAPLPAETAQAMLTALARSGNHPIGTAPVAAKQTAGAEAPALPPAGPPPAPEPAPQGRGDSLWVVLIIGVVIVVLVSGKRRAHRRS